MKQLFKAEIVGIMFVFLNTNPLITLNHSGFTLNRIKLIEYYSKWPLRWKRMVACKRGLGSGPLSFMYRWLRGFGFGMRGFLSHTSFPYFIFSFSFYKSCEHSCFFFILNKRGHWLPAALARFKPILPSVIKICEIRIYPSILVYICCVWSIIQPEVTWSCGSMAGTSKKW